MKIGKTSLAAQAPNCLLLATERGYNTIPGIYAVDITCWRDMREVFRELKKPEVKNQFKVLIVDTIDLAAKYCTKYICNANDIADLSDLKWGKGHSLMRSEFEDVFNSLAQMGYAIIFISHVRRVVNEDTGEVTIGPSLSPDKVNDIIRNMADVYAWAHYSDDEDHSGDRILTIRSNNDNISCGSRFPYMRNEIPFSYDSLVNEIRSAVQKEGENSGSDSLTDEPIQKKSDDIPFEQLESEFKEVVNSIKSSVGASEWKSTWVPRIKEVTEKYLGSGKRIADCTPAQAEQVSLVIDDLKEAAKSI